MAAWVINEEFRHKAQDQSQFVDSAGPRQAGSDLAIDDPMAEYDDSTAESADVKSSSGR